MIFSARYSLKVVSSNVWNEYFNSGLMGFARGYKTSVEACSWTKFFLQSETGSTCKSINFLKPFCSEANRRKENTIYKVKEEMNGGSAYNPLMPRMNYVKKGMHVETGKGKKLNVKEGDFINLINLLFTEKRDYLIKYNDDKKVKAEHLGGKAMLIYFVPVSRGLSSWMETMETEYTTCLIDIYNDLLANNDFEVIIVAVDELLPNCSFRSYPELQRDPEEKFETMFSRMPWTAIPFSDIASRKRIAKRFGVSGGNCAISFFLDSKGVVLTCDACLYFGIYGTLGYPFTDERIRYLDFEDYEVAKQPSLETLLGSPVRDYVISNKGNKVPIQTLKDKVVALYFYEDGLTEKELTIKLKMAYKESANKENFEVVLLYLYDTHGTLHSTNEESFWKTFETMPWLALPFKDPNHKKLRRIFYYPDDLDGPERPPTLVILGPNIEFVDPCGADILMEFGAPACPFTRKRLAKLETEKIKELKPEMLWDPNTAFRVEKDGLEVSSSGNLLNFENALSKIRSKIPFSQFSGKRLLIYFEMDKYHKHWLNLSMMEERYLQKKGTDEEFEVIHIKKSTSDKKFTRELPWLVHYYGEGYSLPTELDPSIFNLQYDHSQRGIQSCLLLAFERDGSIVRKSFYPTFGNNVFPFYAGGLEKEFLDQINDALGWSYWKFRSQEIKIYRSMQ